MIPLLQCRLAKDGRDTDLEEAFRDVKNRSERMKHLIRLGLKVEQGGVIDDNETLIFDGQDLAPARDVIVAQIGTNRVVLRP
jgi:hypothetical protein